MERWEEQPGSASAPGESRSIPGMGIYFIPFIPFQALGVNYPGIDEGPGKGRREEGEGLEC